MALLNLIRHNTNIDFVGIRKYSFTAVIVTTMVFIVALMFKGLNYGIDFRGGILLEMRAKTEINVPETREKLSKLGLGEVTLQQFGGKEDLLVKIERQEGDESAQTGAIEKIKQTLGDQVEYRKVETVGPKVGAEMVRNGVISVALALLAIMIYIAFRFEWRFGICAIVALAHDCFLVLGLFSLFPLEFNETAITAILICASYSINDTIVVFDRIRENIGRYRKITLAEIINRSINETLSRTILTVATTMLSVIALYLFGGSVIATFVLPIMVCLVIGTLSSIFVAAPLLLLFNVRHGAALDEDDKRRQEASKFEMQGRA